MCLVLPSPLISRHVRTNKQPRPYPWPAGHGGLTHIEKVSLEGEQLRKTPDFARTLAIASALNDHHWVEPHVAGEWRAKAKRELDEMAEQQGEGDEPSSSSAYTAEDEGNEQQEEAVGGAAAGAEGEEDESSSPSSEGSPVWPKGVVGLI